MQGLSTGFGEPSSPMDITVSSYFPGSTAVGHARSKIGAITRRIANHHSTGQTGSRDGLQMVGFPRSLAGLLLDLLAAENISGATFRRWIFSNSVATKAKIMTKA